MDASQRKGCTPGDLCERNNTGDSSTTAVHEYEAGEKQSSPFPLNYMQALKTLQRRQDIVIKPADKSAVVIKRVIIYRMPKDN